MNNASAEAKALKLCDVGEQLQRHGDVNGALTCYQDALKHNPKLDLALNNIGIVLAGFFYSGDLQRSGPFEEILNFFESSARCARCPESERIAEKNLVTLLASGKNGRPGDFPRPDESDFLKVLEITAKLVGSPSATADDNMRRAECLLACCTAGNRQEFRELALKHIRFAVAGDTTSLEYNSKLGAMLMTIGKPAEAAEVFDTVLKLAPNFGYAHFMLKEVNTSLSLIVVLMSLALNLICI
jgi:tetratricopeptide (TPR) repeat protein